MNNNDNHHNNNIMVKQIKNVVSNALKGELSMSEVK